MEKGKFYDFEKGVGGSLVGLIGHAFGLDRTESLRWANEFTGGSSSTFVPTKFSTKAMKEKTEEVWVSVKPEKSNNPPSLNKLSPWFSNKYNDTARYAYKDENGVPLFYTIRMEDKEKPKDKMVLPISYGYFSDRDTKPGWKLKSFAKDDRPIYHLNLIADSKKVLIVEGEKTADAASNKLAKDGFACVTWQGGASAVTKTNWLPLVNKEVYIWPDNDQAGFKAADDLCSQLRKVGAKSIHVVDKDLLSNVLPEKWDLADDLPEKLGSKFISDALLTSISKKAELNSLILMRGVDLKKNPEEWFKSNEVLARVEERMRPDLELKYQGNAQKINAEILGEAAKIFYDYQNQKIVPFHPTEKDKLSSISILYRASTGVEPSTSDLIKMNEQFTKGMSLDVTKEIEKLCGDKALAESICSFSVAKLITESDRQWNVENIRNQAKEVATKMLQMHISKEVPDLSKDIAKSKSTGIDLSVDF